MNFQTSFIKHVLAIFLASVLAFLSVSLISSYLSGECDDIELITIKGNQNRVKGHLPFLSKEKDEIELAASLSSKEQLTMFGSSEFSRSKYCSYNYLPEQTGLPVFGLGSPFHQSFSIYCELLAFEEYLENSKICIVLSPGWFETDGTNPESFLKFFKSDFQRKILHNKNIEDKYKSHIGNWVYENEQFFNALTPELSTFKLYANKDAWNPFVYLNRKVGNYMHSIHDQSCNIPMVSYEFDLAENSGKRAFVHPQEFIDSLRTDFINSITNNEIYVNDEYYRTQLLDNGVERVGWIDKIELQKNQELEDLKMLLELLRDKSANASFIIQPLNPYFYVNHGINEEAISSIAGLIEEKGFPCLNMYMGEKTAYEAGILKDVMHLGDYGWMKINVFLDEIYHLKDEEIN